MCLPARGKCLNTDGKCLNTDGKCLNVHVKTLYMRVKTLYMRVETVYMRGKCLNTRGKCPDLSCRFASALSALKEGGTFDRIKSGRYLRARVKTKAGRFLKTVLLE
jgi:hypothetical protein